MEEREIRVKIPNGYEIDKENSTFECIKFKPIKKELPKTWEEFCETHPRKAKEAWLTEFGSIHQITTSEGTFRNYISDKTLLPNIRYAEAMLALCQLIQLRDCYNDNWVPDWSIHTLKSCIGVYKNTRFHKNQALYAVYRHKIPL
jgi:hypothetical protein